MNTIATDLANITGGMAVSHYANDDDNFVEAVAELVDLGHDRNLAEEALSKWINDEPTWDCAECGTENIEEAGWANCPNCEAVNPSVVTITHAYTGSADALQVMTATKGDFTLTFDRIPGNGVACHTCGSCIVDWTWTTENRDSRQKARCEQVNLIAHVEFHARLGF